MAQEGRAESLNTTEDHTEGNSGNSTMAAEPNAQADSTPIPAAFGTKRKRSRKCTPKPKPAPVVEEEKKEEEEEDTPEKKKLARKMYNAEYAMRDRSSRLVAQYAAFGLHSAFVHQMTNGNIQVVGTKAIQDVLGRPDIHRELEDAVQNEVGVIEMKRGRKKTKKDDLGEIKKLIGPSPSRHDKAALFEYLKKVKETRKQNLQKNKE